MQNTFFKEMYRVIEKIKVTEMQKTHFFKNNVYLQNNYNYTSTQ